MSDTDPPVSDPPAHPESRVGTRAVQTGRRSGSLQGSAISRPASGSPIDRTEAVDAIRLSGTMVGANANGSPLDHLLAGLLALVGGVLAAGLALVWLMRPGTYRGERSLTWTQAPDLLKLLIALVLVGSIFLLVGSLVGKAVPRAWGWSVLVAWVPMVLLVFNAVGVLRPDLAVRIAEVPIVAELARRLPLVSRHLLGLAGLQVLMLAAAALGGSWGAASGKRTSPAAAVPKSREMSEEVPGPTDRRALMSATDPDEAPAPRAIPAGVRMARDTDAEGRDDRRSMGRGGYW